MTAPAQTGRAKARGFGPLARSAYRTLGLAASASQAEVFEAAEALRLAARLGVEKNFDADVAWLGPAARAESDVRDALGRLADPPQRAFERLFWFQRPARVGPPPTPDALMRETESLLARAGPAARHDAALFLLAALYARDPQLKEPSAWERAFKLWREVCDAEEFWSLLVASDLKGEFEQVLTFKEAADLRLRTPRLVSKPLADAAHEAVLAEDRRLARRALSVLRAASLPEALADEYENEILGPVAGRLEDACDLAFGTALLYARDTNTASSKKREYFDRAWTQFNQNVRRELLAFVELGGAGSFHVRGALAHAASKLNELADAYRHEGWTEQAVFVYRKARSLAAPGSSPLLSVEENLRQLGREEDLRERSEEDYARGLPGALNDQRSPPKLFETRAPSEQKEESFGGCVAQIIFYLLIFFSCAGLEWCGLIKPGPSSRYPRTYNFNAAATNYNFRIPFPQFTPYPAPKFTAEALGVPGLSNEELRRKLARRQAVAVDVRGREEYDAGHIPGALSVPGDEVERRADELRRRPRQLVLYGATAGDVKTAGAVLALRLKGLRNVAVLEGGFRGWAGEGLPTDPPPKEVPAAPPEELSAPAPPAVAPRGP